MFFYCVSLAAGAVAHLVAVEALAVAMAVAVSGFLVDAVNDMLIP